MPNCKVTTNGGERVDVEADGFFVMGETGFVMLKRREKVEGDRDREATVAIFYRPDKVLLPSTESSASFTGNASGSFTGE
jgi:hypothetical protein